jgi:acid phosphatase
MLRARYVVIVAAVLWVTAPTAVAEPPAPPSPIAPAPAQPANIGDLKAEATRYYDSGAYLTDLQSAA